MRNAELFTVGTRTIKWPLVSGKALKASLLGDGGVVTHVSEPLSHPQPPVHLSPHGFGDLQAEW